MAPANGSSKSRKVNHAVAATSKAAPKKPVVPALPLKRHAATASSASPTISTASQQKSEQRTKKHEAKRSPVIDEKPTNGADGTVEAVSGPKPPAVSPGSEAKADESSPGKWPPMTVFR